MKRTRQELQAAADRAVAAAMTAIGAEAFGIVVVVTGVSDVDGPSSQVGIASNLVDAAWARVLVQLGRALGALR